MHPTSDSAHLRINLAIQARPLCMGFGFAQPTPERVLSGVEARSQHVNSSRFCPYLTAAPALLSHRSCPCLAPAKGITLFQVARFQAARKPRHPLFRRPMREGFWYDVATRLLL